MIKKTFLTLFIALNVFALHAQSHKKPSKEKRQACPTVITPRIQKIRDDIPGKTMGAKLESLLFWSQTEEEQRFPIMQDLFPSRPVPTGNATQSLEKGKLITPQWQDSTTLKSYLTNNHIAGIIVLTNGKIRLEYYRKGVTKNTVWTSFSMAKSVTSMLLGVALKEGDINSLDDPLQKYIPTLRGYDYGRVTIRELLTMTSGIQWNEDYANPKSDVAQMYLKPCQGKESHILTYMRPLNFRHKPGKYWHYSTGETDLLGILIQKATGKSLAEYLSEKIWQPLGMQHCAYWLIDECSGLNIGGSGLSATLRDYAKLGLLMLRSTPKRHPNILSKKWRRKATALIYPVNDNGGGYGYLWWRYKDGSYAAIGIFGQMIFVNPQQNLVLVQLSAWPRATSKKLVRQRYDFIKAVERGL